MNYQRTLLFSKHGQAFNINQVSYTVVNTMYVYCIMYMNERVPCCPIESMVCIAPQSSQKTPINQSHMTLTLLTVTTGHQIH